MTDQDYAIFCNAAYRLRRTAEEFCAKLGDEEARQLDGLIRMEMLAEPEGDKAVDAFSFLASVLANRMQLTICRPLHRKRAHDRYGAQSSWPTWPPRSRPIQP